MMIGIIGKTDGNDMHTLKKSHVHVHAHMYVVLIMCVFSLFILRIKPWHAFSIIDYNN